MPEQNTEGMTGTMENEKPEDIRKLQPTLFIGLGGTGMEVILRIRRRILHATWGTNGSVRVGSLEEFPVAEFMHFDLDQGAVIEEGRAITSDPLAHLVKLPIQDRVITGLDLLKYSRNEDDLHKYSNIASWFPLTTEKVRSLGLDPSKGAGQMRPISRLYFFDNYRQTRDTIAQKLDHLKANRHSRHQLSRLKLETEGNKVKIVVVGSIAGGTGAGSFLDMGWLARSLALKAFKESNYDVQLVLFTPRGYARADKDQTEANGYAALMELETCMRGYSEYVGTWFMDEGKPTLDPTPYTDVYIIETANMGRHALEEVKEVYEMVADALFEDLSTEDFANKKRSIAVNQQKHKGLPYHPNIPEGYGEMKLNYYMGYSSFGQSILDTQYALQLDDQEYRWCAAMLEAFFCVSAQDTSALRATDQQRDSFLKDHLRIIPLTFDQFPDFGNDKELSKLCLPFIDNQLTDDLLIDEHGGMEEAIQQKINVLVEQIKSDEHNITEWPRLLRDQIPALEQDVIRNQDTSAETSEDRITRRRLQVLDLKKEILRNKIYDYLDDQDYGGLVFVTTLIELIKTYFDNQTTGLAKALEKNAQQYIKIRDALKTHQIENTIGNIATAVEKKLLKKPDSTKAKLYLDQLKQDLGDYLRFHIRGMAAKNAAILLGELSVFLGTAEGMDEKGKTRYTGLMEEFLAGRREVEAVAKEIRKTTERIEDSSAKQHANYILLPVKDMETPMPSAQQLRSWANEAFKDFEGSKKIFPLLKTLSGKDKLIARLRSRVAEEKAAMTSGKAKGKDPLLVKLTGMDAGSRQRVFSDLLRAAMPWIDANFSEVPQFKAQRFKCLLGVGKADDWAPFLDELRSSLPTYAGITAEQFQTCTTGIPGRAVCYCELSGFPLRALAGLENWRISYRHVSKDWPLHTHIDPTLFVHPLVPSSPELKERASDFRLFLLAVMLRVLTRNPQKTVPPGQYRFDFGHGDLRNFGNERAFRMNGLPPEYRHHIEDAIRGKLDECDPYQLMALSILAFILGRVTYAPKMAKDDTGKDYPIPGFSYEAALKLSEELSQSAQQKGIAQDKIKKMENKLVDWDDLYASLSPWTEEIPNSASDAYTWEVEAPNDHFTSRSKRRVKKEFFDAEWLVKEILSEDSKQPGEASNVCPFCRKRVNGNQKFCPHCGNQMKLGKNCSGCGCVIEGNPKFCPECGVRQGGGMQCSKCGCTIEDNSKFCPECGKPV